MMAGMPAYDDSQPRACAATVGGEVVHNVSEADRAALEPELGALVVVPCPLHDPAPGWPGGVLDITGPEDS
jgi:hypothetical protein